MTDVEYILKDLSGAIVSRMRPMDDPKAVPVLPPWMVHNITHLGWRLEKWESKVPGFEIQTHGYADWKVVAEGLAASLQELLTQIDPVTDEAWDLLSEEEQQFHNDVNERLRVAMETYDMAQFEVMVINPVGVEPDQKPEEPGEEEKSDAP